MIISTLFNESYINSRITQVNVQNLIFFVIILKFYTLNSGNILSDYESPGALDENVQRR